ncbi:type I secretion system permease/ATPase [Thauera aromatica]|uniref:type I secretion system permease/ATPase n=1 Tax=Thauera aromatica TaxID=59405 RepID=UPI001FFD5C18|nr:type I secretion system permease/ATPase [Thauera aromatica]MCK2089606.1 type I secretion system permease/ATPase [Thauera aromatica]
MNPDKTPSELREAVLAFKPHYWRAFRFALIGALLVLAPTAYMFEVYGRVVDSRSHITLAMLTLLVVLAFIVMEVLDWARSETMREAGQLLDQRMAPRIFQALYESNLRRSGAPTVQPMNDFRTVRDFLPHPVLGAVMESPISLVFMVILFLASPVLGWTAVAGAVVQVVLAWLNERSTNPPLIEANRAAIGAQQYADGSLRNAEVIEAMGMLHHIHRRWMEKQHEFLGLQAEASDKAGAFQAGSKFVQTTIGSLLLGLGGWLILEDALAGGPGMMIVASVLGGRMLAPLVQMVSQWRAVVNVRDAWRRLDKLLAQIQPRPPAMALPAPRGIVSVDNLIAAAPGSNAPILRGVAFGLQPGEVLAVVGPSASGKTTLARLLVGLWPTNSGKVRLDGADVFAWDKLELGPHLGYLPQGVELLDGTLAENIARFGEVDLDKVHAAARAVGLHEFILSLPQGYDSPVGRDGAILSGGQRQRVALARALYGEPVFVVLDEPNSSLDDAGDAALAQAIARLKARGTTFVVMTHRTSVLAVADKMLVLRDGAQQAFGPRDQVLAALNQASQQAAQQAQGARPPATGAAPAVAAAR